MYEYYYVYTIAQIELMNIDVPMTCYRHERGKNDPPSRKEMDNAVKKWEERKKHRKWKMEDLLKGKLPKEEKQLKKE
ncbi:hypothetical protein HMPREF9302_04020 [Prevotella amnii DNF00058]|uniref:Uncharacterized protein n=2 Tax=Prevotella amnii TaxID=419005 RepID=A0A096B030_9BACT|nr:hypothetical protein HMPREF9302_04020 [Prevotella amnii DNF00058]